MTQRKEAGSLRLPQITNSYSNCVSDLPVYDLLRRLIYVKLNRQRAAVLYAGIKCHGHRIRLVVHTLHKVDLKNAHIVGYRKL